MTPSSIEQFLQFVLPQELLEHFDLTDMRTTTHARTGDETLHLSFEEHNTPPVISDEHRGKRVLSKGFNHPLVIQDFPIRARLCALHIKTRRWEIEGAGSLTRLLSFLPDGGLKLTMEFAAFLKETDRTRAGGSRTHRETLLG